MLTEPFQQPWIAQSAAHAVISVLTQQVQQKWSHKRSRESECWKPQFGQTDREAAIAESEPDPYPTRASQPV